MSVGNNQSIIFCLGFVCLTLTIFGFRLDNKSHGRASMSSEPKVGPESDTDSMAEYGDGDTGTFLFNFVFLFYFYLFFSI